MTFTRMFNALRYSSLPPSYLYKSKLFFDRMNKNRNISSLHDNTYKSSLWSKNFTINIDWLLNFTNVIKVNYLLFILFVLLNIFFDFFLIRFMFFTVWKCADIIDNLFINLSFFSWLVFSSAAQLLTSYFYPNLSKLTKINAIDEIKYPLYNNRHNTLILKKYLYNNNTFSFTTSTFIFPKLNINFYNYYKNIYALNLYTTQLNLTKIKNLDGFAYLSLTKTADNCYKSDHNALHCLPNKLIYKLNFLNTQVKRQSLFFITNKTVNNFKWLEYFKWLSKYSTIHIKSLTEISILNNKVLNIDLNINKFNNLYNNSLFNYKNQQVSTRQNNYLNNLATSHLNNNTTSNNVEFKTNQNWLNVFANLNKNYGWFVKRNMHFTTFWNNINYLPRTKNDYKQSKFTSNNGSVNLNFDTKNLLDIFNTWKTYRLNTINYTNNILLIKTVDNRFKMFNDVDNLLYLPDNIKFKENADNLLGWLDGTNINLVVNNDSINYFQQMQLCFYYVYRNFSKKNFLNWNYLDHPIAIIWWWTSASYMELIIVVHCANDQYKCSEFNNLGVTILKF